MVSRDKTLQPLGHATKMDDVVDNLDLVIEWAIRAPSTIGYFAVLYRRGTVAVQEAVAAGEFNDPEWIEQMDVLFANRYFDALNSYFHPAEFGLAAPGDQEGLTLPWEVAFTNHNNTNATMLQHMMASLNAHICYDLGIAAVTLSANSLDTVEDDFNHINDIVSRQTKSMLEVVRRRSPAVRWIGWAVPDEVGVIRKLLIEFRTSAWLFAINMAEHPDTAREIRVNQVAWTSGLGAWYLNPPEKWTPLPLLARVIGSAESPDIGANVAALAGIQHRSSALAGASR